MQADNNQAIDRTFLARFTLDNAALEREILELFAHQTPLYVAQLRSAANAEDWKQAAHAIKGSALAVGAHRLASVALAAERLQIGAGHADGEALRQQSVDAVAAAAAEACRYIACLFATA